MRAWWEWRKRQLLYDYLLQILPTYPIDDSHVLFLHYYEPSDLMVRSDKLGLMGRYPLALTFHWWRGWAPEPNTIQEVYYEYTQGFLYDSNDVPKTFEQLQKEHHQFVVWLANYYLCEGNDLPWTAENVAHIYNLSYEYTKLPHLWERRMNHYRVTGSLTLDPVHIYEESALYLT